MPNNSDDLSHDSNGLLPFEKGDPANLKGRAIIYTYNMDGNDKNGNPLWPAYIIATKPDDFLDVCVSIPGCETVPSFDEITRNYELGISAKARDMKKLQKKSAQMSKDERRRMMRYLEAENMIADLYPCDAAADLFLPEQKDAIDGDVVRIGTIPNIIYAEHILDAASAMYYQTYITQLFSLSEDEAYARLREAAKECDTNAMLRYHARLAEVIKGRPYEKLVRELKTHFDDHQLVGCCLDEIIYCKEGKFEKAIECRDMRRRLTQPEGRYQSEA